MGPSGEHECSRYLERWIFKADRFGVASVIYSLHYGQPMNMICEKKGSLLPRLPDGSSWGSCTWEGTLWKKVFKGLLNLDDDSHHVQDLFKLRDEIENALNNSPSKARALRSALLKQDIMYNSSI